MNPEHIYGNHLLDDLHNHFPDLLYNCTRFSSVAQVLQYINDVVTSHGNIFYMNNDRYNSFINSSTAPYSYSAGVPYNWNTSRYINRLQRSQNVVTPPVREITRFPLQQHVVTNTSASVPAPIHNEMQSGPAPRRHPLQSTRRRTTTVPRGSVHVQRRAYTYPDDVIADEIDETILSTLSGIITTQLGNSLNESLGTFLDSIPVRPSEEQIHSSTDIETFQSTFVNTTNSSMCTICQEVIALGNSTRKIRHCGHIFHKLCIDTWFSTNPRCPICRHDIREYAGTTAINSNDNNDNDGSNSEDDMDTSQ